MGDFNATTSPTDTTTSSNLLWHWLQQQENSHRLIDAHRLLHPQVPHTRTRRYGTTTSYIDRIYLTNISARLFTVTNAQIHSLENSPGAADHDMNYIQFQPWHTYEEKTERCSWWNHRSLKQFNTALLSTLSLPPISNIHNAESWWTELSNQVKQHMFTINRTRQQPTPTTTQPWDIDVKTLL